jgi:hypothetical protein
MSRSLQLEGKRLWLQLLAPVVPLAAAALLFSGWLSLPLFPASFVVAASLGLWSLVSTGWAANQLGIARFQRGGDWSAIYWLHILIYSCIGLVGLVAFVRVLAEHAA